MPLLNTLHFILDHPLNRGRRVAALRRFAVWQIGSRLRSGGTPVEFVEGMHLLVSRGQTGATGNIYGGLHEVAEMGFVLHVLREGDLFVDIGANVGSYTILAAATGAECIAFEPGPAVDALAGNVRFNNLTGRVDVRRSAVGSTVGEISFTSDEDTLNHVATAADLRNTLTVPVTTLDAALGARLPTVIKIDVEGFEREVLEGAGRALLEPSLLAVIIETNGSGTRYGSSDDELHSRLVSKGFSACSYDPLGRALTERRSPNSGGNTIYVRDVATARTRAESARRFRLSLGRSI